MNSKRKIAYNQKPYLSLLSETSIAPLSIMIVAPVIDFAADETKKKVTLKEHDLFVVCPGEKIHYTALTPWSIQWVGLYGNEVERCISKLNINAEHPIDNFFCVW